MKRLTEIVLAFSLAACAGTKDEIKRRIRVCEGGVGWVDYREVIQCAKKDSSERTGLSIVASSKVIDNYLNENADEVRERILPPNRDNCFGSFGEECEILRSKKGAIYGVSADFEDYTLDENLECVRIKMCFRFKGMDLGVFLNPY